MTNDVAFFKHHRQVKHRNGTETMKTAPLRKSICNLPLFSDLMWAANRPYLHFISAIDDPISSFKNLEKISRPAREREKTYLGFNLFQRKDLNLFPAIFRGEFNISGFQNRDLSPHPLAATAPMQTLGAAARVPR
ncbi:MAG: hypothetical protein HQK55_04390 [Deltaproteobacteria bacterium]|nr:hypothetical protein [Deltaproteobacteria bacterium]